MFGGIISALLVITAESPIISVLYLILLFICAASYLILAGIPYFGIVYIVVYVGAIAILFIFVVMLFDLQHSDILESSYEFNLKLPLSLILGTAFFLEIGHMIKNSYMYVEWSMIPDTLFNSLNFGITDILIHLNNKIVKANLYFASPQNTYYEDKLSQLNHIQAIGENLYTQSAFLLIVSSLIFLLGMISPIVLSLIKSYRGEAIE